LNSATKGREGSDGFHFQFRVGYGGTVGAMFYVLVFCNFVHGSFAIRMDLFFMATALLKKWRDDDYQQC
jgi:hypothetical protein